MRSIFFVVILFSKVNVREDHVGPNARKYITPRISFSGASEEGRVASDVRMNHCLEIGDADDKPSAIAQDPVTLLYEELC